jgi:hypothetical protein
MTNDPAERLRDFLRDGPPVPPAPAKNAVALLQEALDAEYAEGYAAGMLRGKDDERERIRAALAVLRDLPHDHRRAGLWRNGVQHSLTIIDRILDAEANDE